MCAWLCMCIYGNYSFDKPLVCLGKETAGLESHGVAMRWLRSAAFSDSQSVFLAAPPYSRLCPFYLLFLYFFLKKKGLHKKSCWLQTAWKSSPFDSMRVLKYRKLCSLVSLPAYFRTGKEMPFQFTLDWCYSEKYLLGCLSGSHPCFPFSVCLQPSWGGAMGTGSWKLLGHQDASSCH